MKRQTLILSLALLLLSPLLLNAQVDSSRIPGPADTIYPEDAFLFFDTIEPSTTDVVEVEPESPRLEWSGYLLTDDRVRIERGKLNWQEYRLDLKSSYRFGNRAKFYAECWLRGIKTPGITQTADLMYSNKVMPVEIDLREAYFDIYGLFTKNLDVRIGRQRIAWGTGDRLNPTDNLNPYDLEDIWDFGRHTASNALQLNYYHKSWTITAVGILNFVPAILPGSDWTPAFMPQSALPELIYDSSFVPGMVIPVYIHTDAINDTILLPERDLKHSPSLGAKIKKSLGAWDLSLSYIYNRETLPVLTKAHTRLNIDSLGLALPLSIYANAHATVDAQLRYPTQQIIGFDFAGSLWGIGLRGEAACFIPEKTILQQTMQYSVSLPPLVEFTRDSILPDSVISDGNPYVKFLIGLDYTFKHNIYLNFQYLHGFIHEKGMNNLTDYFVLGLEWTTPNERLKLAPLNGAVQVGDWKNIRDAWAVMYMPEVKYSPVQNAEISLGAHIIGGEGASGFSKVNKNDDVYLKFRYSF